MKYNTELEELFRLEDMLRQAYSGRANIETEGWNLWKYTVQDGTSTRDFKPIELWWARMEWLYDGYERQSLRVHFEREIKQDWYAEIESDWDSERGEWGPWYNAYTGEKIEDLELFVKELEQEND